MQKMTTLIAWATSLMIGVFSALLMVSFFVLGNEHVLDRLVVSSVGVFFGIMVIYLARSRYYRAAAWLLIGFYLLFAASILVTWGINTPLGLLLLGLSIVLAGVMLGSSAIIAVASIAVGILLCSQTLFATGMLVPDYQKIATSPTFGDAIGFATILLVATFVSWLSRGQLESSLQRALRAEAEVLKEKKSLAQKLTTRTRQLKASQLEEMRQLYHFAELGQASTVTLHELANHLTLLTLSIDDLSQRHASSQELEDAQQSITALELMIEQARSHIATSKSSHEFSLVRVLKKAIKNLETHTLTDDYSISISMEQRNTQNVKVRGSDMYFTQIIRILVNNAKDAYQGVDSTNKKIRIKIELKESTILITVSDYGKGVTKDEVQKLFKIHKSNKPQGMGVGLYVAKGLLETHFGGSLHLDTSPQQGTHFIITIPIDRKNR